MAEIAVTGMPRLGDGQCADFDLAAYGQKHFGMFAGQEETVRLRCRSRIVGVVLDRFGPDVMLVPDGPEHFTVTLPLVVSPQFFGWLFGLEDNVELLGRRRLWRAIVAPLPRWRLYTRNKGKGRPPVAGGRSFVVEFGQNKPPPSSGGEGA